MTKSSWCHHQSSTTIYSCTAADQYQLHYLESCHGSWWKAPLADTWLQPCSKAKLIIGQGIQANLSSNKRRGITGFFGGLSQCSTTLVLKTFFFIHHLLQLVPTALFFSEPLSLASEYEVCCKLITLLKPTSALHLRSCF